MSGGSIPSPLEDYAIIILVIAFVVIIVIVVIGIAIIATIAVVASIKQLVDIQHATDRRDEDDPPVATPAELLERFPDEEGTGYAVSDIVVIVSPTAATATTAARRRRRVATEGSAIRRVLQQDRVPPRRRRVGEGGGGRRRRRRRVAVTKWERTRDGREQRLPGIRRRLRRAGFAHGGIVLCTIQYRLPGRPI